VQPLVSCSKIQILIILVAHNLRNGPILRGPITMQAAMRHKRRKFYFKSWTNSWSKASHYDFIHISYLISKKKKEKETCTLVILVYRTCENRVDENPAFSLYSLLYLYELKKKRIYRRKPEQRFAINFIQTSSVQDGVAVIEWGVWFVWWVAWRFLITEMVSPRGDDIARETVLKVFKMCNMCLSVTWEKESKRER